MKKIMTMLFVAALFLSAPADVAAAQYPDVKSGHWAYEAISDMSGRGVVEGFPNGNFAPNEAVTYGQFIKMALIVGAEENPGNSESGNWARKYYDGAIENAYFTKYDIPPAALSAKIPRGHMALIISRVLGDARVNRYNEIQARIVDIDEKTPLEYDITKACAAGVLTGYPDGTFRPEGFLSRAEAATAIHRLAEESKRILPLLPSEAEGKAEKTVAERFTEQSPAGTGFGNVIHTSKSKRPISEVVDNLEDFSKSELGDYRNLDHIKYYEIVEDYPYEMKIVHNLIGGEMLDMGFTKEIEQPYIIKDRKLAEMFIGGAGGTAVTMPENTGRFPDYDFIGFETVSDDTMILIPNPNK
ncbi:MAG: S-layer homology domain-containing protein [Clostridiales Family XIII bacterium]|jgi:hypothetical protein|nr:S-layer homology domain-containing protein [Clostridiales Family XIII bacterium]